MEKNVNFVCYNCALFSSSKGTVRRVQYTAFQSFRDTDDFFGGGRMNLTFQKRNVLVSIWEPYAKQMMLKQ
jgi:hypothetical protein